MNWNRRIRYWITVLCSQWFVRLAPLVAIDSIWINRPWEQADLYHLCGRAFSWECVAAGPLLAHLIILSGGIARVDSGTAIIHMGGRSGLFCHMLLLNVLSAFFTSVWFDVALVLTGGIFHAAVRMPFMVTAWTMVRTCISFGLLLNILGLLFMIIQWLTFRVAAVVGVTAVVGLEAAGGFYLQKQLFWGYALPADTVLYLSFDSFWSGMLYLALFAVVLLCVFWVVLQKKSFIMRREGMNS